MKRTGLLYVIVFIAVFSLLVFGSFSKPDDTSYFPVLKSNWGIALPENAGWSIVYEKDTGPSFHGDGIRYHVYSYDTDNTVSNMLPWLPDEGNTLSWEQVNGGEKRYHTYTEDITLWLTQLEVPETEQPVFQGALYWYDNHEDHSQIMIVWNPHLSRLYIVESFL